MGSKVGKILRGHFSQNRAVWKLIQNFKWDIARGISIFRVFHKYSNVLPSQNYKYPRSQF